MNSIDPDMKSNCCEWGAASYLEHVEIITVIWDSFLKPLCVRTIFIRESPSPALMLLVVPQIWAHWGYMAFGVTAVTNSLLEKFTNDSPSTRDWCGHNADNVRMTKKKFFADRCLVSWLMDHLSSGNQWCFSQLSQFLERVLPLV